MSAYSALLLANLASDTQATAGDVQATAPVVQATPGDVQVPKAAGGVQGTSASSSHDQPGFGSLDGTEGKKRSDYQHHVPSTPAKRRELETEGSRLSVAPPSLDTPAQPLNDVATADKYLSQLLRFKYSYPQNDVQRGILKDFLNLVHAVANDSAVGPWEISLEAVLVHFVTSNIKVNGKELFEFIFHFKRIVTENETMFTQPLPHIPWKCITFVLVLLPFSRDIYRRIFEQTDEWTLG
jgi:hypothetical protein